MVHSTLERVTRRIVERSEKTRQAYIERMMDAKPTGPARSHHACSNLAHAVAGAGEDQSDLATGTSGNLGIVTAYNDMLSAHKPYEGYPEKIREAARSIGGTAQVAGGVPAMCDGVTQGTVSMELSLFSRDAIAMAAGIALSHDTYDSAVYLGICDKIVPGLVIAAQTFGHIPAVFIPAGPMTSGLPNDEKAKVRQQYAAGEVGRDELMAAERASYHGQGTCTFYGTANTNQMLMEFMGLQLAGSSFINPNTPLREALTREAAKQALSITALGNNYLPTWQILDERAFVNGIVGLNATGGSTNLLIHLIAMARAGGILLDWEDFDDLSNVVPLLARVYPNGVADVNHFHAAGGLNFLIDNLSKEGLLHTDVKTVSGDGLERYTMEPKLVDGDIEWVEGPKESLETKVLRPVSDPFMNTGGLKRLKGNMGTAVMKTSAVAEENLVVQAPARVFTDQESVKEAFKNGEFQDDVIVVVKFQGPKANGMPELHGLTPVLSILQARGLKVALVTDGRMSGASGKVPSAIHVSPEAVDGGAISKVEDGDIILVDGINGAFEVVAEGVLDREPSTIDLSPNDFGSGRELFSNFRKLVTSSDHGATIFG